MAINRHTRPENRRYPSRNDPSLIQISPADVGCDFDFNFNCPKLDRCTSLDDPLSASYHCDDSPADRLFVNGMLLPHEFPIPRSNTQNSHRSRLMISRTSSGESSIGGGSSSASTGASSLVSSRSSSANGGSSTRGRRGSMSNHQAGRLTESQRWQVIATPVPGLGSKAKATAHNRRRKEEPGDRPARKKSEGFFQGLLSTCKRCHALEVPRKDDVLRGGNNMTSTTIY